MKKGWFHFGAALLLLTMAVVFVVASHNNDHLRSRVAESRDRLKRTVWIQAQNTRMQQALEFSKQPNAAGNDAIQDELRKARAEVANLERVARLEATRVAAESVAEEANTDPAKGIVQLRNFRNAGMATPSAAFQTAVWAVMKDHRETGLAVVSLTESARIRAVALLANLPQTARAEYPDPESLAVLALATQVTRGTGFEILGSEPDGAAAFRLKLRVARGTDFNTFELPMVLGPMGWQIVVSEESIHGLHP